MKACRNSPLQHFSIVSKLWTSIYHFPNLDPIKSLHTEKYLFDMLISIKLFFERKYGFKLRPLIQISVCCDCCKILIKPVVLQGFALTLESIYHLEKKKLIPVFCQFSVLWFNWIFIHWKMPVDTWQYSGKVILEREKWKMDMNCD